ncbi:MAG: hypothetical protein L6Q81_10535 [Bacteroidia bacterium]|nr:hypothetical protein [Bacteroidia bacterium]
MNNVPSRYLRPLSVAIYYGALAIFNLSTEPSLFLWYFAFLAEFLIITIAANVANTLLKGDGDWFSGTGFILSALTYLPIPLIMIYFSVSIVGEADAHDNLFSHFTPQILIITVMLLAEYSILTFIEVKSKQVTDSVRQFVAYVLLIAILTIVGIFISGAHEQTGTLGIILILGVLRVSLEFVLRRWLSKF